MSGTDKLFAGSIPDIYDDCLVPLIFETYAEDLAARVASAAPQAVLEIAAGTGVVSRALAPRLVPGARYVVTDLNQPMLDRAARRQPPDPRITWQQADAMALPFADGSFDAVCCQFGVMFLPDKVQGFREVRRVLRPGGLFFLSVWDRIEENIFARRVTETVAGLFPENPPLFLARLPHGYHDVAVLRGDLESAGFGPVAIETVTRQSRAETPRLPAVAYCQGTPLRAELEARAPQDLEAITARCAEDLEAEFGPGPVSGKIQGHVAMASR
ncbi:class I SAM-dependent methyltransferase [Rhodobacteraceae bacterium DSL-40]|uniref:class I SAM-dependent methyltransferase n=1 Tax=Amaricoccus sp. B4 TaxID=3368557 RepID=UPI000DADEC53